MNYSWVQNLYGSDKNDSLVQYNLQSVQLAIKHDNACANVLTQVNDLPTKTSKL